eukprot:SAG31_NODE_1976_length_6750_cov_8.060893_6_plen_397_part_00
MLVLQLYDRVEGVECSVELWARFLRRLADVEDNLTSPTVGRGGIISSSAERLAVRLKTGAVGLLRGEGTDSEVNKAAQEDAEEEAKIAAIHKHGRRGGAVTSDRQDVSAATAAAAAAHEDTKGKTATGAGIAVVGLLQKAAEGAAKAADSGSHGGRRRLGAMRKGIGRSVLMSSAKMDAVKAAAASKIDAATSVLGGAAQELEAVKAAAAARVASLGVDISRIDVRDSKEGVTEHPLNRMVVVQDYTPSAEMAERAIPCRAGQLVQILPAPKGQEWAEWTAVQLLTNSPMPTAGCQTDDATVEATIGYVPTSYLRPQSPDNVAQLAQTNSPEPSVPEIDEAIKDKFVEALPQKQALQRGSTDLEAEKAIQHRAEAAKARRAAAKAAAKTAQQSVTN